MENNREPEGVILTARHANELRQLIKKKLGINISREKDYLLENKIAKILRYGGDTRVEEFIEELKRDSEEMDKVLARFITTGHTFFFREREHMDYLCREILQKGVSGPKIWCAASSTGEEPYSIMISLLEHGISDFVLLASDVNIEALKACRRGVYKLDRLREVHPLTRDRYFKRAGTDWQVKEYLNDRLILKRINLLDPLRFEQGFDYIFCRNVYIYFDNNTQRLVTENLLANLEPGGKIFVGLSEPLLHLSDRLTTVAPSVYVRKS
jgi:chemotaxis protein methyltransferase CheR